MQKAPASILYEQDLSIGPQNSPVVNFLWLGHVILRPSDKSENGVIHIRACSTAKLDAYSAKISLIFYETHQFSTTFGSFCCVALRSTISSSTQGSCCVPCIKPIQSSDLFCFHKLEVVCFRAKASRCAVFICSSERRAVSSIPQSSPLIFHSSPFPQRCSKPGWMRFL